MKEEWVVNILASKRLRDRRERHCGEMEKKKEISCSASKQTMMVAQRWATYSTASLWEWLGSYSLIPYKIWFWDNNIFLFIKSLRLDKYSYK